MTDISTIVQKFNEEVDTNKEYTLKELKEILSAIYKKPKSPKTTKTVKTNVILQKNDDSDDDAPKKRGRPRIIKLDKDGNPKEKRPPSAYNKFVAEFIKEKKDEYEGKTAKELMSIAAAQWKVLSQDDKDAYKS